MCYMTKEELEEIQEKYLRGYLIEAIGYTKEELEEGYSKDDIITIILVDSAHYFSA